MILRVIRRAARALDRRSPGGRGFAFRLALANLHRPGNPLRSALLSLGSALTLLVVCTLVVAALLRSINATIPGESPALVLYDIGSSQLKTVGDAVAAASPDARLQTAPLVRARISAVNEVAMDKHLTGTAESRSRASRNDYKLSYPAGNIDSLNLVEGDWGRESAGGTLPLAMEDREVGRLGLALGDRVRFGIEGAEIETEIIAIYSQKGLQTRFWFEGILPDGSLEPFIHRHVGAAWLDDAAALDAQRRIARAAPNVITVRTARLLEVARDLLGRASSGLLVVAIVSLAASLLVLVSVMAAGRSRQVYDATVLSTLGARMSVIRRSLRFEYLLLALITSSFAVLLGSAIALPLLQLRLKLPAADLAWLGAITALGVSILALGLGAQYPLRMLRLKPATLLRGAG
jgi:putative ABC transport system permease protein